MHVLKTYEYEDTKCFQANLKEIYAIQTIQLCYIQKKLCLNGTTKAIVNQLFSLRNCCWLK